MQILKQSFTVEMTQNRETFCHDLHDGDEGMHLRKTRESLTLRLSPLAPCLKHTAPVKLPPICAVWINHTPAYAFCFNSLCSLTRADSWNTRNINKITVKKKKRGMRFRVSTCTAPELLFSPRRMRVWVWKEENDPQIGATLAFSRS